MMDKTKEITDKSTALFKREASWTLMGKKMQTTPKIRAAAPTTKETTDKEKEVLPLPCCFEAETIPLEEGVTLFVGLFSPTGAPH